MQSTGHTSTHAWHPVQLSARTTASSFGSFLRGLPTPFAMSLHLFACEWLLCTFIIPRGPAAGKAGGRCLPPLLGVLPRQPEIALPLVILGERPVDEAIERVDRQGALEGPQRLVGLVQLQVTDAEGAPV